MAGNPKIANDERLDPRIRATFEHFKLAGDAYTVADRDEGVALFNRDETLALRAEMVALLDAVYGEDVAPSAGLTISDHQVVSQPDGNTINLQVLRPEADGPLPCVYYIHGGGMMYSSMHDGNYRAWLRILAAKGVAVVAVDFRNAGQSSSVEEVAPFPAGLNDCVSGLRWLHEHADEHGIDRARVVIAGESGGGNLTIASALQLQRDGDLDLVSGLYAMCPYLAGSWPREEFPSSTEHTGKIIEIHGNLSRVVYGIEAFEDGDPLAWPLFATEEQLAPLPRTVIRVNECDPLRDEGIAFYRRLLAAGVAARCDQIMGTVHAIEVMPTICPDITHAAAADIAGFARTPGG